MIYGMIQDMLCQDDFFLKIKENMLNIKVQYVKGMKLHEDMTELSCMQKCALNKINTMNERMNNKIISKYEHSLLK